MQNRLVTWLLLVCLIAPFIRAAQSAQAPSLNSKMATLDELFQTIATLDKQVFDAVDRCDMKTEASFWADDAEFYHDKNGLMVGGAQIVDAVKNNLCGKVKRELVSGTLEVYPLEDMVPLRSEFTGSCTLGSRTMGLWARQSSFIFGAYKDGVWKITRVISIDHHQAK